MIFVMRMILLLILIHIFFEKEQDERRYFLDSFFFISEPVFVASRYSSCCRLTQESCQHFKLQFVLKVPFWLNSLVWISFTLWAFSARFYYLCSFLLPHDVNGRVLESVLELDLSLLVLTAFASKVHNVRRRAVKWSCPISYKNIT